MRETSSSESEIESILPLRDEDIEPPVILPANHKIASLIISDRHNLLHYASGEIILSELKEFWIVKGRQQTNKVWFACVTCKKLSSQTISGSGSSTTP